MQWFRPTNQTLSLQVEKRFHQLEKDPANQNVDIWLTEWTAMYHEAKRMDVPEVSEDQAIRDFLLAVESVDFIYGNGRQEARDTIEDQNFDLGDRKLRQRTMDEEIERFRNHIRLQQNTSVRSNIGSEESCFRWRQWRRTAETPQSIGSSWTYRHNYGRSGKFTCNLIDK